MAIRMLPFLYEIEFVPQRGRIKRRRTVHEIAAFEVPEVTSAEAPVAMHIVHRGDRVMTLNSGGRSYRPVASRPGKPPIVASAFMEAFDVDSDVFRTHFTAMMGMRKAFTPYLPGQDDRDVFHHPTFEDVRLQCGIKDTNRRLHGYADNKAKRLAQATAAWSEAIVMVDGHVWSSAKFVEPHVMLFDLSFSGRVVLETWTESHAPYQGIPFRMDQLQEAMDYAAEVAEATGATVENKCDIEILETANPIFDCVARSAEIARKATEFFWKRNKFDKVFYELADEAALLPDTPQTSVSPEDVLQALLRTVDRIPFGEDLDPISLGHIQDLRAIASYWRRAGIKHHPQTATWLDEDFGADVLAAIQP